ncbi:MAG TPA: 2-dehydro-3-deoxygalactonokinase [Acidiphilium sp.]
MIGIDWGTSSLRAWRIGADGAVLESRSSPRGIMTVADRKFEPVLRAGIGDWLAAGENRVLLSGMIGSRQGWVEARYLPCPAGVDELAAGLSPVGFDGASVMVVPGLATVDADGVPEVMRGEETQILGAAVAGPIIACLPGTHSKWAKVVDGRITGFTTYMTGEVFAALGDHTILAHTVRKGPIDEAAFDAGLARARGGGGLLHHVFGARTLVLRDGLGETAAFSYLSGLLIGHEMAAAFDRGAGASGAVKVIGAGGLGALYARAIASCGGAAETVGEAATAAGLALLGGRAKWQ